MWDGEATTTDFFGQFSMQDKIIGGSVAGAAVLGATVGGIAGGIMHSQKKDLDLGKCKSFLTNALKAGSSSVEVNEPADCLKVGDHLMFQGNNGTENRTIIGVSRLLSAKKRVSDGQASDTKVHASSRRLGKISLPSVTDLPSIKSDVPALKGSLSSASSSTSAEGSITASVILNKPLSFDHAAGERVLKSVSDAAPVATTGPPSSIANGGQETASAKQSAVSAAAQPAASKEAQPSPQVGAAEKMGSSGSTLSFTSLPGSWGNVVAVLLAVLAIFLAVLCCGGLAFVLSKKFNHIHKTGSKYNQVEPTAQRSRFSREVRYDDQGTLVAGGYDEQSAWESQQRGSSHYAETDVASQSSAWPSQPSTWMDTQANYPGYSLQVVPQPRWGIE